MDFQGFQNSLPPSLLILLVIILYGLAWVSYRKFESIPTLPRWVLITLRGSALVVILLLLLNPYFYSSNEVEVKPKIAVFLDNSESIAISKGNYEGLSSYQQLLDDLGLNNLSEANVEYYSIGEDVQSFEPDSLNGSEVQTNLSAPVNTILEMEEDVQTAIFISDGIITFGRNPVVSAYNSSIPIYTVSIGDTSAVRDISVSNVLTNATGYTNTNHLIEAEISQTGFENNSITVSLVSGDEILDEQQLTFDTNNQVKTVEFELLLEEAGLKQLEVIAQPQPDEWTEANNSQIFSIDVLDDRVKILHVAFEIHPDIKALRTIIARDENNELYPLTWLGGNRFVEELPDEEEYNLIIVHGVPNTSREFEFLSTLEDTPTIFLEVSDQSKAQFDVADELQLIGINTGQVGRINLMQTTNNNDHPILELPEINLRDAPPLTSATRSVLQDPQSTPLFSLIYNGVETEFPVVSVLERGNIRRGHVLARGWYKMLQSTNVTHRNFVTDFFSNLVSWTSSDPDDRMLQISPAKQVFSTAENPIINASLRNERGEPESEGIIEVTLSDEDSSPRTFNMDNIGNGNYRLDLPRLSEGLYNYSATARKGNRELETQTGEFLISNASSELANTTRNDELMRAIAQNSEGSHFIYDNINGFQDSLRQANILETRVETIENYSFPVRTIYWFIAIILLLGSEWFLRKYYSLP
ncbi:MAG: hypothetical protein RI564_04945 [Gracilimonas sp.]|nr:hypothetical protein [Gracilimonas sp.]